MERAGQECESAVQVRPEEPRDGGDDKLKGKRGDEWVSEP
jgi:hypothetical protein